MSLLFALVLAASSHAVAPANIAGRYEAVTETEYSITLTLKSSGHAQYEFVYWSADHSARDRHEKFSGTWSRSGDMLTLRLASGNIATYSVVSCLSHQEFDQAGCSPGLSLVNTTLPNHYELKRFGLWNSALLKRSLQP